MNMKSFVIEFHERNDHREFIWETQAESESEASKLFYLDTISFRCNIIDIKEGKWDRENYKIIKENQHA
jgi:hypothetical protein